MWWEWVEPIKKYHTVETIPKSNIKIIERGTTHKYMIAHFLGLVPELQYKLAELG
jgi:hypothetical protein